MVLFVGSLMENNKESLIGSIQYQQTIMIHTKRVIFMIVPLLFVPLVYGISSTSNACAVPPDPGRTGSNTCGGYTTNADGDLRQTCCWKEGEVMYCQTCTYEPKGATGYSVDCSPKVAQMTTPPTTGESVLPGGGLAEHPEQPPLFGGQNDAGVPPTGGIEQPPTSSPPQRMPGGGANVPSEGESTEQPPQTVAPQDDQDDNQGGGLPTIKNKENVPSDGGVAEQPEDDGQEEGAETAGPLT
jgi:hypothetical protein